MRNNDSFLSLFNFYIYCDIIKIEVIIIQVNGNRIFMFFNRYILLIGIFISNLFPGYQNMYAIELEHMAQQPIIDVWDMTDGLPSNTIRFIDQTPDGYLWIGTEKGLVQFNSVIFKMMVSKKYPEINQLLYTMLIDKEDSLWIGTAKGIFRYKNGQFQSFSSSSFIAGKRISAIEQDFKGNLFIGSFDHPYLVRFKDNKFTIFNKANQLNGKEIHLIFESSKGHLLIGLMNSGIYLFQDEIFIKKKFDFLTNNLIFYCICEDRKGQIWIGTNKGLIRININNKAMKYTVKNGLSSDKVRDIIEDKDGNLWVGTFSGINLVNEDSFGNVSIIKHIESDYIYCLFQDQERSIWLGTNGSGLKRFRRLPFVSYSGWSYFQNSYIASLYEDHEGTIWVGTAGGLYQFKNQVFSLAVDDKNHVLYYAASRVVAGDLGGNIWVGTDGNGLFKLENGEWKQFTTHDGLLGDIIRSIFCDSMGKLWIGTLKGVNSYYHDRFQSFPFKKGESFSSVFDIYEDKNQNLWIATDDGVIFLKDKNFTQSISYLEGIPIFSIYEDNNGIFWITTDGHGIIRYDGNQFIPISIVTGLGSGVVYQITDDDNGNFWMGSKEGILKVRIKDLNDFCEGLKKKIQCVSYSLDDGMLSTECSKYSRYSALKTKEQEIWFATKNGISILNPSTMTINKTPPSIVIEKIEVNGREVPFKQEKYLFKNVNRITFHIGTLSFIKPDQILLKACLDNGGKKIEKVKYGRNRIVRFGPLDSANYKFIVTACNSDGVWNLKGASISFVVKTSFYKTIFFKVFLVFSAIIVLVFMVRWFPKKVLSKRKKSRPLNIEKGEIETCLKKLTYILEIEKIYQEDNLSLNSLAEKLSVSPRFLSWLINNRMNTNFYNLINQYRVEEAKKLLVSKQYSENAILRIAYDVGFNSKSAFNRAFKKITKITPSDYKKKTC